MMQTGDFNPHFFDYGGVTLYLQMVVACMRFVAGALSRRWTSVDQLWIGDLLVYGRLVTALIGTGTILVVYQIGKRWGPAVAVIAALVMAFQPQHVRESHFALTDTPLTFLTALTLLLSLRATEKKTIRAILAAGAVAGLTVSTKYNGVPCVLMPLGAIVAYESRQRGAAIAATLSGVAAGFLIGSPYSILDLPHFLNGLASLTQQYNQPRSFLGAAETYVKYMRNWFSLPGVLSPEWGWLGMAVVALGVGVLVRGATDRDATREGARGAVVRVRVLLVYFKAGITALRPVSAAVDARPLRVLRSRRGAGPARARSVRHARCDRSASSCSARSSSSALVDDVSWDFKQRLVTTSEEASAWVFKSVRSDEHFIIENDAVQLPPQFHAQIVGDLIEKTADAYTRDGVTYLIASSARSDRYFAEPDHSAGEIAAYRALLNSTEPVAKFAASRQHPGPTILILKLPR